MTDQTENNADITASGNGHIRCVTLLNSPSEERKTKIIDAIVLESRPDKNDPEKTQIRVFILSDLGTQSLRILPEIVRHVQKIQNEPLTSIPEKDKTGWPPLSELTFIGQYGSGNLDALAKSLSGLSGAGHFGKAFAEAVENAAKASCNRSGDVIPAANTLESSEASAMKKQNSRG